LSTIDWVQAASAIVGIEWPGSVERRGGGLGDRSCMAVAHALYPGGGDGGAGGPPLYVVHNRSAYVEKEWSWWAFHLGDMMV